MAINLASIFQNAQQGPANPTTPTKINLYNQLGSDWGSQNNSTMSDVQTQQNGVPSWIQNALGINAQSMDQNALNKLNTDYNLTTTRDGRNWNYNLADQGGNQIATHQYYDAPFSLMNDFVLPAATIWGGGALLGGALGSAGIGAGLGGAEAGGLSGMDLAADAALGSGNNIATAGSMLGGGTAGTIAGTNIPQFAQQPGYGQQFGGALADASGGTPYTGAASGGAVDPIGQYLTTGASEGSTIGGAAAGGGATGAVGAGSLAGLLQGIGGAASTIGNIPGVSKVGGNLVTNLLGSVLGGTGQGVSGTGNLGSLFTNYNQYQQNQDIINQIKGIYSPTGDYAKYLENQLGRRDAAAGRNSQYGPRLAELTGRLAEGQASNLAKLSPFLQGQQGGLNGMVGAGQRLLDGAGGINGLLDLFKGGSQGGMTPAPTTNGGQYIPNPDYNPVDDNWWSNPQYGP